MKFSLVLALLFTASAAQAQNACDQARAQGRNLNIKECKNSSRRGSDIKAFVLTHSGDFYAYYADINQNCQITNGVKDFKASQHPNDAAAAYYITYDNTLYYAKPTRSGRNCPSKNVGRLAYNVKSWPVVSNTNTTIVNIALTQGGQLTAWPNSGSPVYTDSGVEEVSMNDCYGVQGKSFNSYVMFTLDRAGNVTKVKGQDGRYFRDDKTDNNNYRGFRSISEFKAKNNVCK